MARDPFLWPFPWNSIWNMPIGEDAELVDAGIGTMTGKTFNVENDILIQMPDAPTRDIEEHTGAWSTTTRCAEEYRDGIHASDMPIPAVGEWEPRTITAAKPNHSTSILVNDGSPGIESWETQPFHICAGR